MKHLRIKENIDRVQIKINTAAEKSGRRGEDIKLIAVTKRRSIEEIREAINCGVTDIGENYIQEATSKYCELGNIVNWHMIGHIQTNKAKLEIKSFTRIRRIEATITNTKTYNVFLVLRSFLYISIIKGLYFSEILSMLIKVNEKTIANMLLKALTIKERTSPNLFLSNKLPSIFEE